MICPWSLVCPHKQICVEEHRNTKSRCTIRTEYVALVRPCFWWGPLTRTVRGLSFSAMKRGQLFGKCGDGEEDMMLQEV